MDWNPWRQRLGSMGRRAGRWARRHPALTAALALLLLVFVVVRVVAAGSAGVDGVRFDDFREAREGGGDDLLVVMHGLRGDADQVSGVIEVAREIYPDADLLVPELRAGLLSNADPWLVASALEIELDQRDRRRAGSGRPYRRIVLVGFSLGALVVRKAYVWGHGGDLGADRPAGLQPHRPWVDRVERIVLLAGMNRGWSTSGKVDEPGCRPLRTDRRMALWLGKRLARLTGTAGLHLAIERGAPFVADLRVQWIRLSRPWGDEPPGSPAAAGELEAVPEPAEPAGPAGPLAAAGSPAPAELPTAIAPPAPDLSSQAPVAPVIQLLGDIDDMVTHCDSQDLAAAKDFLFVPVRWTGHLGIVEVASRAPAGLRSEIAAERRQRLAAALGAPIDRLRADYPGAPPDEDPEVEQVVFVMHGIRDFGEWTTHIEAALAAHPNGGRRVAVVPSSYGYFPMGSFLLLGERQKNVRWFMDRYTEAIARYPRARMSYVGHSNGTYLLASALERYRTLRVDRVLFAGSVVRSGYRWGRFQSGAWPRVGEVRNVVATGDAVVGIFPRLYELITERSPVSARGFFDLGAAGFRGFGERQLNLEFAEGGHGAALDEEEEIAAIAEYLVGTDSLEARTRVLRRAFEKADAPQGWADWSSKLCWLVWAALIAGVILLGRAFHRWVGRRWPRLGPFGWFIYALLLLAVLQTV